MKYGIALLIAVVLAAGCIGQTVAPTGGSVSEKPADGQIIEFYGAGCPHCERMAPIVAEVEQELNITIDMKEVWSSDANRAEMTKYKDMITAVCNGAFGVPAFINLKTNKAMCGEKTVDELKAFILG
jgi:thiol-disulfide isomerase/thioredoxin